MPRRTGKMLIIKLMIALMKLVRKYGTGAVTAYTNSSAIGAALDQLAVAVWYWYQQDDFPGEVDREAPLGSEDFQIPVP